MFLHYMKDFQAENDGHDDEGDADRHSELFRLRPSLCMVDDDGENKKRQHRHIEQRKERFVVY